MNLAEMQAEVEQVNRQKGWYDDERTFGELIALLHSEASEALEAFRLWGVQDHTPPPKEEKHLVEFSDEPGFVPYEVTTGVLLRYKPEGVGSELADVLIRLIDMCSRYGIDLEAEYRRKIAYNRTRPYHHGGKRL